MNYANQQFLLVLAGASVVFYGVVAALQVNAEERERGETIIKIQ